MAKEQNKMPIAATPSALNEGKYRACVFARLGRKTCKCPLYSLTVLVSAWLVITAWVGRSTRGKATVLGTPIEHWDEVGTRGCEHLASHRREAAIGTGATPPPGVPPP